MSRQQNIKIKVYFLITRKNLNIFKFLA